MEKQLIGLYSSHQFQGTTPIDARVNPDSLHEFWWSERSKVAFSEVGFTARKVDGGVRRLPCQTYMRRVMSTTKKVKTSLPYFRVVST
jgi:hypothetical protein